MNSSRPRFSRFALAVVLLLCALGMLVLITVLSLQLLHIQVPPALLTVMHVQTVALPVGSSCLLGYAAIRERRALPSAPVPRDDQAPGDCGRPGPVPGGRTDPGQ